LKAPAIDSESTHSSDSRKIAAVSGILRETGVHLALYVTMMVWGLNLAAVKLLTQNLDILLVALLRMVLAAMVFGVLLQMRGARFPRWRGRTLVIGFAAAFLMVYVQQILFAAGLARTSATNAALILALGPFISAVLEWAIFRRALSRGQMAGIGIALAGVSLVILNRPDAQWTAAALGDVLILGSVLSFATGGVAMQKLAQTTQTLSIGAFMHMTGAAMLLIHAGATVASPVEAVLSLGWKSWCLIMFSAIFASAFGALAWAKGIAVIGVGRTASYLSWVPIFGVAFAVLFLNELLTLWHLIGVSAVLVGSILAVRSPPLKGGGGFLSGFRSGRD